MFQSHLDSAVTYFAKLAAQAAADHNAYWQGRALFGLAEAQLARGTPADARRTMARFRPISRNPDLDHTDDQLQALRYAGDARALVTRDSLTETRSAFVGEARLVESRALLANGDTVAARTTLEPALPALRTGAGDGHPRTQEAATLLATLSRLPR